MMRHFSLLDCVPVGDTGLTGGLQRIYNLEVRPDRERTLELLERFGTGHGWETILYKVLVDQLLFSPFISAPIIVGWLLLRDHRFHPSAWKKIFCAGFVFEKVFPVVVAGWCVWVPGVVLVYFMPSLLQIPVAVIIQVFWVLIITTMEETLRRQAVRT